MANFKILSDLCTKISDHKTLVVMVDGELNTTVKEFYTNIAASLKFPEEFGANLDAFDEMINDLEWLSEKNIFLVFRNYDEFLSEENDELREIILTILDVELQWRKAWINPSEK